MALITRPTEEDLRKLMPPPPPQAPKRKAVVLEEDEFEEKVEAIVERDYFPDLPKMKNQLEWLQAVNSKDPALIRQAQLNIARRRAGLKTPLPPQEGQTPAVGATPATWGATPGTTLLRTPAMTPFPNISDPLQNPSALPPQLAHLNQPSSAQSAQPADELKAPNVTLDQFLLKHTSEDDASFSELQEKTEERKRMKYAHLLEDKNVTREQRLLITAGPSSSDGCGTTGQKPDTLVHTTHHALNNLFYDPTSRAVAPLTMKEVEERSKGPAKQIFARNTRLKPDDTDNDSIKATASAAVQGHIAQSNSEPNLPTGALPHSDGTRNYNYMATPSLTDASPLMTWGDLEATPLRLDTDELDVRINPATAALPAFTMAEPSAREQLGRQLASKAAASLKSKSKATPLLNSLRPPTPRVNGQKAPLTPAAQALAAKLAGKSTAPDPQLRASYSASVGRPATGGFTPVGAGGRTPLLTPVLGGQIASKGDGKSSKGTAAKHLQQKKGDKVTGDKVIEDNMQQKSDARIGGGSRLTDNLLNL